MTFLTKPVTTCFRANNTFRPNCGTFLTKPTGLFASQKQIYSTLTKPAGLPQKTAVIGAGVIGGATLATAGQAPKKEISAKSVSHPAKEKEVDAAKKALYFSASQAMNSMPGDFQTSYMQAELLKSYAKKLKD
jgi:hypothetical protein